MTGIVNILNVGHGDTKLSFNSDDKNEVAHAKKVVESMLKLGYALLIQVDEIDGEPIYRRAKAFDAKTCEYIIASTNDETINIGSETKNPKKKTTRISAKKTKAVAVAPIAGG